MADLKERYHVNEWITYRDRSLFA